MKWLKTCLPVAGLMLLFGVAMTQPDPQVSFGASNPDNSDYRVLISFSYNDNYCDCGPQSTETIIYEDVFFLGETIATYLNITANNATLPVGPGYSKYLAAGFFMSGERTWLGTSAGVLCVNTICGFNQCPCGDIFGTPQVAVSTAALKNPVNVVATSGTYLDQVVLNWDKGTDFPDGQHDYRIYRDGDSIATVPGTGPYTYIDAGLPQGANHDYTIKTHIASFGDQESSGVTVSGSTFSIDASDGEFFNRVRVRWSNAPTSADDIRIERSTHDDLGNQTGREEIAILSKSATAYNDNGGIPGFVYIYYITPLDNGTPIIEYSNDGYSKPNGKLSGHVRSPLGTGVLGVDISVELLTAIPAGGAALPGGCVTTYCATTDIEGYFEIPEVYYFSEAEFRVTPAKTGHQFTPAMITRTLNQNDRVAAGLDFVDETVFTVGGRVTFPESPNNVVCGVAGAKILVDGNDFGIKTNQNGEWGFTILEEDTVTFSVDYFDHQFEDPASMSSTTVYVDMNIPDLDFEDVETGDITVVAQGSCKAPLGDSVLIQLAAAGCYLETYYTNAEGVLVIQDVPARDYSVKVLDIAGASSNISTILAQIGNIPIAIDLTTKDSIAMVMEYDTTIITPEQVDTLPNNSIVVTPADTTVVTAMDTIIKPANALARFIYRSPLEISVDFEDAGAQVLTTCQNSDGDDIILMEQGQDYFISIDVKEALGADCFIDSGYVKIYDFVSDRGDGFTRVPIINGIASYVITAGEPEIASSPGFHDHEKLLYIVPEVDLLTPEPMEYWVLVTGFKGGASTYFTRSPEVPQLIIHDPPGDNSYAFVEEGETFRSFTKLSIQKGGAGGVFAELALGSKINLALVKAKVAGFLEFSIVGGRNDQNEQGLEMTMEFTDAFSTSSADNFTGGEGDVYIGASFNHEYSIGTSLMFDASTCSAATDSVAELSDIGFATTFFYTEKHVRSTLLPTIALLLKGIRDGDPNTTTSDDTLKYNRLVADSIGWNRILAQNALNRDSLAVPDENFSFSAGATLNRTYSTSAVSAHTYEYEEFVEGDFAAGVDAEVEAFTGYFKAKAGVIARFRESRTVSVGADSSKTRTVGFVLDDGDIGDFFTVDVKRDTAFNVPSFKLLLGTTSCPHEENTQRRDNPQFNIYPPAVPDVPADGEATFVAQLTNKSESGETREYHVRVVSTTNPDGATFLLGGRNINNGPASFFLEVNQTLNVALTARRGPLASTYERVGIMMYPPCEYALWEDNGVLENVDTAYIDIYFQSECTNVNLFNPGDGWLVNQNDGDILHATFTGYDVNNPYFESLTLQFKREGQGYVDQITIPKDSLTGPYYDVFLDVSNYADGNYRLRARANCGVGIGYTYSSEQKGIIDRASLAPFGMPSPADGFLQEGQEVSVLYDKDINCVLGNYPTEISLVRDDTSLPIPFTTECLDNKLIIVTNPPLVDMPDLDGVEVTARVHLLQDLNGNVQKYPVEWTFKVNAKPVFWDPDPLYASAGEGQVATITGILKNDALISKSFSLDTTETPGVVDYPEWLTPLQTRGTVLSNGTFDVDFAVDPDLTPGIYQGVVAAAVDSLPVAMDVTFELFARPVNWSFDPARYEHSMNVVAQFSLTDADAPLSSDPRDLVAAFVNGEIRGIANIEYVPNKDSYVAFLTVYSNDGGTNAEDISFHFWHALSGVEYKAVETQPFQLNGSVGTADAPLVLHPAGIYQVIPLKAGWNWISLSVESPDMSRETVFESIISGQSTNTILIKSQIQTAEYSPMSGWGGNMKFLELGKGYLVHLSDHDDTLRVAGFPPAVPVQINVSNTWNWIGFPEQVPRPVDEVLSGLTATTGNLLKSQHAFSAYDGSINDWVGNLASFEPGKGYKLLVSSNGTVEFDLQSHADPTEFEFNMNVTAVLDPTMLDRSSPDDLNVCAMIDGVCYGEVDLEYIEALDEYRAMLLITGNAQMQDAPIEFRVVNASRGTQYFGNGDPVTYTLDGIVGTLMEPYQLFRTVPETHGIHEQAYELFQNVPNPMRESTTIAFRIPVGERVIIDIFSAHGDLIRSMSEVFDKPGLHAIEVALQDVPDGVYFYRMSTPHFSALKKMIKHE